MDKVYKKKYVIYAPPLTKSNGIRALYGLYDLLLAKKYDAFIFCPQEQVEKYNYINKIDDFIREKDIVIYPESVSGNPLQFQNVVRWVLYFPGKNGGSLSYHSSETIFTWSKIFYDAPQLYLSGIDHLLFYDEHLPKTQDCYFVNKGGKWKEQEEVKGLLEINMTFPPTREELAKLLKTTRILYSYDPYSAINLEAKLCGAKVKIITEEGFEDFEGVENFNSDILESQLNDFINITQAMKYKGKIEKIKLKTYIYLTKRKFILYIISFLQKKTHLSCWDKKISRYQKSLREYGLIQ